MRLFNKVAIIGVGLIGGSIGLAVKKRRVANYVLGFARHRSSLLKAKRIGAIDESSRDFRKLKNCDLVILACPVYTNISLSQKILPLLKEGAILTDVSSTKEEITSQIKRSLSKGIDFIGSHPLAGSEKRGVTHARKNLFEGSVCILTPSESTKKETLRKMVIFWQQLGAKVRLLTPEKHDSIISITSHLPHAISFSLMRSLPKKYFEFPSTSFKDITRIASSDPQVWCDIFLTNRKNILKAIGDFQIDLEELKQLIRKSKKKELLRILKRAKDKRECLIKT